MLEGRGAYEVSRTLSTLETGMRLTACRHWSLLECPDRVDSGHPDVKVPQTHVKAGIQDTREIGYPALPRVVADKSLLINVHLQ